MAEDHNTTAASASPGIKPVLPFVIAVVVVAVVVLGVLVSHWVRPADDRMSDSAQVQHAINDVYTARNEADFTAYRDATCAADVGSAGFPTQESFVADNRASTEANGPIEIPEITDLVVDGDRATAKVHMQYEKSKDNRQVIDTVVVREGGDWKVCSS